MPVQLATNFEPIPGYRLLERLGRGGFGEVWKVEAPGGIHKAMKFVYGDLENIEDENIRAAEQELKALERIKNIRHPYILTTEQWTIQNGQLIIVMELADRNLWDRFKECRGLGMVGIPRDELLSYLSEAAEALDLMNGKYNLQHLDIKPQNLFLIYNHVKVADFGLAKVFEGTRATVTGGVTPVYAGPETFEGYVSRYTDQYSLAIVFQELLTGTRPFNGSNTKQLVMLHLNGTPDLDALPGHDRPIVLRALAKKPEDRWPTCTDFIKALKDAGVRETAAKEPSAPKPASGTQSASGIHRMPVARPLPAPEPVRSPDNLSPRRPISSPVPGGVPGGVLGGVPVDEPTRPTTYPTGTAPPAPQSQSSVLVNRLRLVTPQTAAAAGGNAGTVNLAPAVTLQRPITAPTMRRDQLNLAPPERTGDGVVMPALIVGLGHSGQLALRALKQIVAARFGPEPLPHLRFVSIDTDPASQQEALTPNSGGEPLAASEFLLSRLNRPAHYLQREGLPSVEQWMPPGVLYRIPRTPAGTEGVRAFGRLALMDSYKAVVAKIRQEIETFVAETPLDQAVQRTQLGLRTNRPRVYLIANLAGGTGSGMFLDLAYILKHEMRLCGFVRPEVVAQLLVPPVDKPANSTRAMANTVAALTELAHFHHGRNRYSVRFDNNSPAIQDSDGPFTRCHLVQLSKRPHPAELAKTVGLVARAIYLDLLTPAGRVIDHVREEALALNRGGPLVVQATGLYRLSWPRTELLALATQRFGQRMIQRWTTKEAAHLREPIQTWLNEQWTRRKLDLETIVADFNTALRDALRDEPAKVFHAFIDPLRQRTPGANRMDMEAVCRVLEQLLKLVGKPNGVDVDDQPSSLQKVLDEAHKRVASQLDKHISAMAVTFLEQPQYRLGGAEEAIQQILDRLNRTIDGLEGVRADLTQEVNDQYQRLFPMIGSLNQSVLIGTLAGRKLTATMEVLELLESYPMTRLKLLILNATLSVYRGLVASMPEYVRDIGLCRTRLQEMVSTLAQQERTSSLPTGPGRMILPPGVEGLDGTADLFLGALPPNDILEFDTIVQKEISKRYRSLADVCLKPELTPQFLKTLSQLAFDFLNVRLEHADPVAAFFWYRCDDPQQTQKMLTAAFEHAAPDLTSVSGRGQLEMTVLACPATSEGQRFQHLLHQMLPGCEIIPAALPDDIVFLREYPVLPLADLMQLAPPAQQAYQMQLATEFPPHTRCDIAWSPTPAHTMPDGVDRGRA